MQYIIGPRSLASVFVKSDTLETEIPVLNAGSQHCYNGHYSRVEVLGDECRDVRFVCFQMPAELRTRIGARESTVLGVAKGMRLGDST